MICNFPSPPGLCSLGQARIVVPSLVMEFIGTIRQSAPHERGDRVDHHPKFVFGGFHFELFLSPGIASGASSIFGTGRELCFVMGLRGACGFSSRNSKFSPAWMLVSTSFEESAK